MKPLTITQRITTRETDSFNKYLQEVDRIPRLTTDEEYELAVRALEGDDGAREELIEKNLRFVISVAKQYVNDNVMLEDLVNEGNLGLIEAASRFDPTRGFKFISYAVHWIRRTILEYLTKHSRTIRIPSNKAGNITKLTKLVLSLEQKLERYPDKEDIMNLPDIVEGKFNESDIDFFLSLSDTNIASLDKPFGESGDGTLMDTVESTFNSTDYNLHVSDTKDNADKLLDLLPKTMQKFVIIRFFGLQGHEAQDLKFIAEDLGISRERARQIKDNSIRILQEKCKSMNFDWINHV